MLLVYPPIAKASEPPAGVAALAGALAANSIQCKILDANLEGQLWLLDQPVTANDTWSRRAFSGKDRHLAALRDIETYKSPQRYRRAVSDLSRILEIEGTEYSTVINLSDFQHKSLSPLRSEDLIASAAHPEHNPFYGYFSSRLPELVQGVQAVGFSLCYLSQALCTFAMIGFLKRDFPETKIILGGGLITSWMQSPAWSNPFNGLVDFMVGGPGEVALLQYLGCQVVGKDEFSPDFSGFQLDKYLSPYRILPFSASKGCYWNHCSFCPEPAENNRYLATPVQEVVTGLKKQVETYKPGLIHLLDNAISPVLLRALAASPPGAPWYGFARVDKQLADAEFGLRLRASGCVMLKLGIESGDQSVLDSMGKGINIDMAAQVIENLHSAGIATYCYLLFGTPGENIAEARKTMDFTLQHAHAIDYLNLAIFNMPIYGADAARLGRESFYEADLSLYTDFSHPMGWDRRKVRTFIEKEFKRQPEIAAIVRNDPPYFDSNHAAVFSNIG